MAFQNEAPVFAGLVIGVAMSFWRRRGKWAMPNGAVVLTLLALTAPLQYVFAGLAFKGDFVLVLLYVGGAAIAYSWGYNLAQTKTATDSAQVRIHETFETAQTKISWAFVIAALMSSGMAWMQWFGVEDRWFPWVMAADHSNRALGNLAQPNQLSTLLLIGVVAVGALYERSKLGPAVAVALLVLMTSAVVLAESRTAYVSTLVLLGWCAWKKSAFRRIKLAHVIAWGLLFVAMSVLHQSGKISLNLSEKTPLSAELTNAGGRPLMWRQFGEAIRERPWQGYGWLQTAAAQQNGALTVPGTEQTSYTHNQFLDLVVWIGVPGAFAFFVLCCLGVLRLVKKTSTSNSVVIGVALLIPMAMHAQLEFPLAYAYFLIPGALIVGMLERLTIKKGRPSDLSVPHFVAAISITIFALIAVVVAIDYVNIEEDFRVARFENRLIQNKSFVYERPRILLLDQYGEVLAAMRIRAIPEMPAQDIDTLERAAKRYSWAALHFRYMCALALNGQLNYAKDELRLIKNLYGPTLYSETLQNLDQLRLTKYPQLGALLSP
jgi:hypothetical protein